MAVAKDTEKLIRQLSLISYLMAERRPVTATEIRRDVEGYSDMTEDALDEIRRCSGGQFDPVVVEAFLAVFGSKERRARFEQSVPAKPQTAGNAL